LRRPKNLKRGRWRAALPAATDPLQGWLTEAFDLRPLLNTHVTALFRDSHLPTALYKRRNFFDHTPAAVVGLNGGAVLTPL
jgi:hypothetical protein